MTKVAEQFRAGDVTFWGIVALSVWAVAVLGANVSALIPSSVYAALHASRVDGSTLNQLRSTVAALEDEQARLKRENTQLLQRFSMAEDASTAVAQRVGALEISVPKLIESQFANAQAVDMTQTGGIGGKPVTFEVDGGLVSVQQRPLPNGEEVKLKPVPVAAPTLQMAKPADGSAMGVALGLPISAADAGAQWQQMQSKVGTMLLGLSPVLGEAKGSDGKQLVAGPITDRGSAAELCGRLDRQGIPCQPVPFAGDPLTVRD